jgi:hypothetical protein
MADDFARAFADNGLSDSDCRKPSLLDDHDAIFSAALDAGLDSLAIPVVTTPMRRPQANALCERLIGTLRRNVWIWIIPLTSGICRKSSHRGWPTTTKGDRIPR